MLFFNFTTINSNKKVIITKFFKHYTVMDNFDLNEYYNLKYTKIESEYLNFKNEIKDKEIIYVNNISPLMIIDMADILNDFIITFNDFF